MVLICGGLLLYSQHICSEWFGQNEIFFLLALLNTANITFTLNPQLNLCPFSLTEHNKQYIFLRPIGLLFCVYIIPPYLN